MEGPEALNAEPSKEYKPASVDELRTWLKGKKADVELHIDLSSLVDRNTFKTAARLVKGFIEINPVVGRAVFMKATLEQKDLEMNVFSSGITFVEAN
ncbi:MAG: hypothetical protein ABA06_04635 [Parcubacteria bacterium C7867-001]|nr:MAG: hypothetical protein ABA06_04635 [Parcubacteria bacterium C7867-001]